MAGRGRPNILCGFGCGDVDSSAVEIIQADQLEGDPCPVCGFRERRGAKFCSQCGAKCLQDDLDLPMREPTLKGRKVMEETEPPPEVDAIFGKVTGKYEPAVKVVQVLEDTEPPTQGDEAAPPKSALTAHGSLHSSQSKLIATGGSSMVIKKGGSAEDIFGNNARKLDEDEEEDPNLVHKPMEITFWFRGEEITRTFQRRPLGMSWKLKSPVTIDKVKPGGHADELGVQLGWQIKVIAGEDMSGQVYKKISKTLGRNLEFLPWAKSEEDLSMSITPFGRDGSA